MLGIHLLNRTPTSVQELHELFVDVAEEWKTRGDARKAYVSGYGTVEQINNIYKTTEAMLSGFENLEETEGCDLGCWLGFSTVIQASLGPKRVYGVEIEPSFTEICETYRKARGIKSVRFRAMQEGAIPLKDDSLDWVIINQVLCNAVPGTFNGSLREAFRVIKPGGTLILCDSNNPHCPDTLKRLEKNYRQRELGDGTLDLPNGPNYRSRLAIITKTLPSLAEPEAARLARETCYMNAAQTVAAAQRFVDDGAWPGSVFREGDLSQPPISPPRGVPNGAITDPFALAAELTEIGFQTLSMSAQANRVDLDNDALWKQLTTCQGFYIFADKPAEGR